MLRKSLISTFIIFSLFFVSHMCFAGIFECGIWPGEGIPSFVAKTELSLYKNPSTDSLIVKGIEIPKGQKIEYSDTIYRTTKPGLAKVLDSFSSSAKSYGSIDYLSKNDYYLKGTSRSIDLKPGDTIEYLQNRAEGEGFIEIHGEIFVFDILGFAYQKKVEITSEPVTEWWVHVVDKKKEPIGWVLINEKTVEFLVREF